MRHQYSNLFYCQVMHQNCSNWWGFECRPREVYTLLLTWLGYYLFYDGGCSQSYNDVFTNYCKCRPEECWLSIMEGSAGHVGWCTMSNICNIWVKTLSYSHFYTCWQATTECYLHLSHSLHQRSSYINAPRLRIPTIRDQTCFGSQVRCEPLDPGSNTHKSVTLTVGKMTYIFVSGNHRSKVVSERIRGHLEITEAEVNFTTKYGYCDYQVHQVIEHCKSHILTTVNVSAK